MRGQFEIEWNTRYKLQQQLNQQPTVKRKNLITNFLCRIYKNRKEAYHF